ncbi:hypothetical protein MMF93_09485 [Streptomyces tubbatahanensis]|uniref:Secreted protein n=1 Tax=Streptomyces tubbatahanensis TaxID=2923272 RepID=A0ABY3XQM1_9ACTN|nr:hypothetical protein [Streptomyces tubbatahanensis]UNS96721.1 hypothetical protein MMF93_09485 [Streptomyces tubbatahanensis]
MTKWKAARRARALTVVAAAVTSLVGVLPAAASSAADDGPGADSRLPHRGYVCDRVEHDRGAGVGSGDCRAVRTPRHGHVRDAFVIESRRTHYRVVCTSKRGHVSGYANLPKWVRGASCHRA